MQLEKALIPFEVGQLTGKNWIVFSPHPDDETFGMGGSILKAKKENVQITIALMTDGGLGGDSQVRKGEFQSVCAEMGIDEVLYLDIPDRGVCVTNAAVQKVVSLLNGRDFDAVFFPSPEEYHPDHRATAWLVMQALAVIRFDKAIYSYEIGCQSAANTLVDITGEFSDKKNLMQLYSSQLTENNYVEVIESLNKSRTYTLPSDVKYAEAFFRYKNPYQSLSSVHIEHLNKATVDILPSDRPLVSILIRTMNRREKLIRALQSVAAQSYKNIEVVVVNDGGEDVASLVDEFRKSFKSIRYINLNSNVGRSAAANIAMRYAKGAFFNFLDDDDEFKPTHVASIMSSYRRNHDLKVFYTDVEKLDGKGNVIQLYNYDYDKNLMLMTNTIPIHAVCFSRDAYDFGFRFDESLKYLEDWDYWIQLSRHYSFRRIPITTALYHSGGGSVVSMSDADHDYFVQKVHEKWLNKFTSLEWRLGYEAISKLLRYENV